MARIGIVSPRKVHRALEDEGLFKSSGMELSYVPESLEEMINDLTSSGGVMIQSLKAVLIMDYAFASVKGTNMEQTVAEQFIEIQDLMKTNMLNTKLYLLTRNSDLYDKLRGTVNGISGTYYDYVQIFITEKYTMGQMAEVLQGKWDNKGLYNRDSEINLSKEERMRREYALEIENRRNLPEEILNLEKNTPTSKMSETDYIDSRKRIAMEEKERKEKKKEQPKREEAEPEEESLLTVNIKSNTLNRPVEVARPPEHPSKNNNLSELQEIFKTIGKENVITENKLETDKGVISVVGESKSGVSGLVANIADMYTIAHRKVLIIDMDVKRRMQTVYFKQYDKVAETTQGSTRSLIDALQGYGLSESAVPLTKYLSILSISRDEEVETDGEGDLSYAVSGGIESIILEAKEEYDIIILDIPYDKFHIYQYSLEEVDRNIFVMENNFYDIENFLEGYLHPLLNKDDGSLEELIKKSTVILNKFIRGRHDMDGNEINRYYMRKVLSEIGYPYDRISVAGEIPFYEKWEEQYFKGIRYIWFDKLALGVYRKVFDKIVI